MFLIQVVKRRFSVSRILYFLVNYQRKWNKHEEMQRASYKTFLILVVLIQNRIRLVNFKIFLNFRFSGKTHRIEVKGMDFETLQEMVSYIYTNDIDEQAADLSSLVSPLKSSRVFCATGKSSTRHSH